MLSNYALLTDLVLPIAVSPVRALQLPRVRRAIGAGFPSTQERNAGVTAGIMRRRGCCEISQTKDPTRFIEGVDTPQPLCAQKSDRACPARCLIQPAYSTHATIRGGRGEVRRKSTEASRLTRCHGPRSKNKSSLHSEEFHAKKTIMPMYGMIEHSPAPFPMMSKD